MPKEITLKRIARDLHSKGFSVHLPFVELLDNGMIRRVEFHTELGFTGKLEEVPRYLDLGDGQVLDRAKVIQGRERTVEEIKAMAMVNLGKQQYFRHSPEQEAFLRNFQKVKR